MKRQAVNRSLTSALFLIGLSAAAANSPHTPVRYQAMGVLDFVIDGPALARRGARVDVSGVYIREGSVDVLYADTTALARSYTMPHSQPHIAVIADSANRALRAHLVQCQTDPTTLQLGCPIAIRGRVAVCSVTSATGVSREEPCLEAEGEAPPAPASVE